VLGYDGIVCVENGSVGFDLVFEQARLGADVRFE